MPSSFYQATVDEQAQFSWDSSLFVSDFYHGFKKIEIWKESPQASSNYKISLKLVSYKSNKKEKNPLGTHALLSWSN